MTLQKHKLKSLIGGDSHSDDFNKMVKEPEESEIQIDQESIKTMRSQLIQIHNHILDGLEVFYKFVDILFSHSPDDFDKSNEGSGDEGSGDDDLENKNREAPIMDEVKFCFHKKIINLFLGTF